MTTEIHSQGWLTRLGGSIKGIVFGLILILLSIGGLVWNEHRAIETYRALELVEEITVDGPAAQASAENEGALVHVTGPLETEERLQDSHFRLEVVAARLHREVEMFQWVQKKKSNTQNELGGGSTTRTQYSYRREWRATLVDSNRFKNIRYQNPPEFPVPSRTQSAAAVRIAAYPLGEELINDLEVTEPLSFDLVGDRRGGVVYGDWLFIGGDPEQPDVGDYRVRFSAALPGQPYSAIAGQESSALYPFFGEGLDGYFRLQQGAWNKGDMLRKARQENSILTWIIRFVGWLFMLIGFSAVFRPLDVLADIVPTIGHLVRGGTGLVALLLASAISFVTVAIAWFAVRPILSLSLLGVALVCAAVLRRRGQAAAPSSATPSFAEEISEGEG